MIHNVTIFRETVIVPYRPLEQMSAIANFGKYFGMPTMLKWPDFD